MEPSHKFIRMEEFLAKPMMDECELQEITDNLCRLIRNNEITSLTVDKTNWKFRHHHFIQIFDEVEKNTSIDTLDINFKSLNTNDLKYMLNKLIKNTNIKNLELLDAIFNEKRNCLEELGHLLSIPNKIKNLTLSFYEYNQELSPTFIGNFKNILQKSNIVGISLWYNNFDISDITQIIKSFPPTLRNFTLSFNNNNNNNNNIIEESLLLNFINCLQKTSITYLFIQNNVFTYSQFSMIVKQFPTTLIDFKCIIYDNNYTRESIYSDMDNFAIVIYNNQTLQKIDCQFQPGSQVFDNFSTNEYNIITEKIEKCKENIKIRSKIVENRNQLQIKNKEGIMSLVLSMNRNKTVFLPNEILDSVYTFIIAKNLCDIKNEIKTSFYMKFHNEYQTQIKQIQNVYNQGILLAEQYITSNTSNDEMYYNTHNRTIHNYNTSCQKLREEKQVFMKKFKIYTEILDKC